MNDLISRESALMKMQEQHDVHFGKIPLGNRSYENILQCLALAYEQGRNDAIQTIKCLPSIPHETKWIPCKERLPEEDRDMRYKINERTSKFVILSLEGCKCLDYNAIRIGRYSYAQKHGKEVGWIMGNIHYKKVSAWMPLPEPYKGNTDG